MIRKYIWICFTFSMVYLLYWQNYFKIVQWDLLFKGLNDSLATIMHTYAHKEYKEDKIFTIEELKQYNNLKNGLYLSILGRVFDVTKGAKHYGPGAAYHAFTGRDASLIFITGQFDEEGLVDDVSTVSLQQIKTLDDWVQFYDKNYIYKGKLKGRYYNEDGTPTAEIFNIQQKLIHAKKEIFEKEERKKIFPSCNMEWKAEVGTTVWCSNKSGGIERNWNGVPRMFFETPNHKEYRCVCVQLDSKEYIENKGNLREYSNCPLDSVRCVIKI